MNIKQLLLNCVKWLFKKTIDRSYFRSWKFGKKTHFLFIFLHALLKDSRLGDVIIYLINLICFIILDKLRPCLWKLELGFRTCSLISLLGPVGPKLVFRPQITSWKFILKFEKFIGFTLLFWIKWGLVCEN